MLFTFGHVHQYISTAHWNSTLQFLIGVFVCGSNVADKHKGVAGMMAAFSLILGIFCGIIFSFPLIAIVENFGSSHYDLLVCDLTSVTEIVPVNGSSLNGLDVVSMSTMLP